MQNFEKLKVNLTPERIYMKKECRLKKHINIRYSPLKDCLK